MAVVTRYYGAAAAGADDGTSWANRKAFVVTGAINTDISAFDFTTDTLIARIGPGTHTLTTAIQTFTGTTTPSQSRPCILEGCLDGGARWQPPDPDWCSAQPAWDADDATYPMPVIATTTNIISVNNASVILFGLKFTASGRNGVVIASVRGADWVQVINSTSNTAAASFTQSTGWVSNLFCQCTGTSYSYVAGNLVANFVSWNVRLEGNAAASSGNRYGWSSTTNSQQQASRYTVVNNPGGGWIPTGTGTNTRVSISQSTIADNGGNGISAAGTSNSLGYVTSCMITGAHTNGINITGTGDIVASCNRIRDYTSAAITGNLDWSDPPLNGNITTAGTDADEYVDAAGGDYRIKNTSTYWGKGIGAGDEPPAGGGGGGTLHQIIGAS